MSDQVSHLRAVKQPTADAADMAIRVRDLKVAYAGRCAVSGVTLDVPRGQITAIIGPSGCGKTSVLSSLNRLTDLIPGAQVSGQVHINGVNVLAPRHDTVALRRKVGKIFQRPNPFPLSIRRNLDLPLRDLGMGDAGERADRIEAVLRRVGLWAEVADRLDAPAQGLSGGQQQRLCIARALVLEPEILLMDEPCSALDPIASGVVERLIGELRGDYTVVVVTHNLQQARRIADRLAVFWTSNGAGCLVEAGPAKAIFERPSNAITAAYLEGRCC